MGLHEEAVDSGGYAATGHRLYQLRAATCDTGHLVGLLQGVGSVKDDRASVGFHHRDAAVVNYKVLVSESGAALSDGHIRVSGLDDFHHSMAHGLRREELPFLDVDSAACTGCCHQQVGLTAQKRRNLQYVNLFRSHDSLLGGVYIRYHRHIERVTHLAQYRECLFVAYAGE